jgi:hypothetical protein
MDSLCRREQEFPKAHLSDLQWILRVRQISQRATEVVVAEYEKRVPRQLQQSPVLNFKVARRHALVGLCLSHTRARVLDAG